MSHHIRPHWPTPASSQQGSNYLNGHALNTDAVTSNQAVGTFSCASSCRDSVHGEGKAGGQLLHSWLLGLLLEAQLGQGLSQLSLQHTCHLCGGGPGRGVRLPGAPDEALHAQGPGPADGQAGVLAAHAVHHALSLIAGPGALTAQGLPDAVAQGEDVRAGANSKAVAPQVLGCSILGSSLHAVLRHLSLPVGQLLLLSSSSYSSSGGGGGRLGSGSSSARALLILHEQAVDPVLGQVLVQRDGVGHEGHHGGSAGGSRGRRRHGVHGAAALEGDAL
mmetsp:Transcript_14418/g.31204  ORF Transcript_14418/g.31204 Transcript_14418/m.31204 type:complete len:277 (+) Transcript_14418:1232-2062(+)